MKIGQVRNNKKDLYEENPLVEKHNEKATNGSGNSEGSCGCRRRLQVGKVTLTTHL